ncbi:MAG: hypothetical protein JXA07_04705 [Spirochaetes bacterium]|nr:hypothetical protein [Spirochaetota bacterium]
MIRETLDLVRTELHHFKTFTAGDEPACKKTGYASKKMSRPEIVLARDTAIELGGPGTEAISLVLWTGTKGLIGDETGSRILISENPAPAGIQQPVSFMQIILVELEKNAIPPEHCLGKLSNLSKHLPGFMTLGTSETIWVRIHKNKKNRFSFYSMAQCIFKRYSEELPYFKKMDIVLAAGNTGLITQFKPIVNAAAAISEINKKATRENEGIISCDGQSCDICGERPVCDILRKLVYEGINNP